MNHTERDEVLDVLDEYTKQPLEVEIEPLSDTELHEAVEASITLLNAVLPDELETALRREFSTDAEVEAFIVGVSAGLHHRPRFHRRRPAHGRSQPGS